MSQETLVPTWQEKKIVGVPQTNEKEMAEETTSLCLKIFKTIGVDVRETGIDIAHIIWAREDNVTQLFASL